MATLPVLPKVGGKGSNKLKTDMAGVSGGKTKVSKSLGGGLKKNPGSAKGARKRA